MLSDVDMNLHAVYLTKCRITSREHDHSFAARYPALAVCAMTNSRPAIGIEP